MPRSAPAGFIGCDFHVGLSIPSEQVANGIALPLLLSHWERATFAREKRVISWQYGVISSGFRSRSKQCVDGSSQRGLGSGREAEMGLEHPSAQTKLLLFRILIRVKLCAAIKALIIISSICS